MTQHTLTLRALFFEKLASAFLTLGLPFMVLVLVPVLAVLVRDYVRPADIESKPPAQIENKPINRDQKREIENNSAPDAISRAWTDAIAANNVDKLKDFISRFPTSQYAEEARLQVADANNKVQLIADVLEKQDSKPELLSQLLVAYGLEKKYPLGFAIFYSDGHKTTMSHGRSEYGGISFEPSTLIVTIKDKEVCLNVLPVAINGKLMTNIQDICFVGGGPVYHAAALDNKVAIDIEPLGESPHGAAWVVGMKRV